LRIAVRKAKRLKSGSSPGGETSTASENRFQRLPPAELVVQALTQLGVETQTGVGKTGVVARLGDGHGPVIAVRADMDALPIQEANAVEYASQVPGCMHACGHDAHTAMLLGVAALLSKESIPGEVRLLFQPSEENFDEEGISGAPRMIADGALEGVDTVIALHVDGTVETGTISVEDGPVAAAVDTFKGYVVGRGGHGLTLTRWWIPSG
jgi:amidohydrolase